MSGRTLSDRDQAVLAALGRLILEGRRRNGLSRRSLEVLAGVDQTAISRMERGATAGIALVRFARVIAVLAGPPLFGRCPHSHFCEWRTGLSVQPPRTPWSSPDSPYDEYGYLREDQGLPGPGSRCARVDSQKLVSVALGPDDQDAASRLTEVVSVALGPDD